jgi:CspA family cold shock protein
MDRGYGFIKGEGEEDLFFHSNDLQGVEFNTLKEGQEVLFEKGKGRDSRPQAVNVRLTEIQVENNDEGVDGGDGG